MKKILFLALALAGITAGAQTIPTSTKQATSAAKSSATAASGTSSTVKKVNKTAKTVESTAGDASKYTNNKTLTKTKDGAKVVKDATETTK